MQQENIPVIIGVGEVCEPVPENLTTARSAVDLAVSAVEKALTDTEMAETVKKDIDAAVAVRTFSDSSPRFDNALENVKNRPRAIARRAGIKPVYACYETSGGQSSQKLVNEFCGRLARGEFKAVLLAGAEAIANYKALRRNGVDLAWDDDTDGQVEDRGWGISKILTMQELENEFFVVGAIYGALENARRKRLG